MPLATKQTACRCYPPPGAGRQALTPRESVPWQPLLNLDQVTVRGPDHIPLLFLQPCVRRCKDCTEIPSGATC